MLMVERCCNYLRHPSALLYAVDKNSPFSAQITRRWVCALAADGGLVSSCGRVQSKYRVITWGSATSDGYRVTGVGGSTKFVHRLVARAFIGKPPSLEQSEVNHIDGNPSNNNVNNLEYVTHAQNIQHSYAINSRRKSASDKLSLPVLARLQGTSSWEQFPSMQEAARTLKLHPGALRACCRGQRSSAGGYEIRHAIPSEPALLPGENWHAALHPIGGYRLSTWEVSSMGRVKTSRGIISRGCRTAKGYWIAGILHFGSVHNVFVHRLVARAFIGPPPDSARHDVNHSDGDRSNNSVENLEYTTRSDNILHSYRSNLGRRSKAPAQSKPVWAYSRKSGDWRRFESMNQAAGILGISSGNISKYCRGICRRTADFEFCLDEPNEPELLFGEEWRDIIHDA